ncbi:MAG: thioredoxin domain-containing protein [Anaerolineales bacterium]|jgi:uncharacterized protein YyaL (SSP411 family)
MPNRLSSENSPYLLQHAENPVDWFPWGEEALEKAKKENKPIFLSIGYAACHWCHVMEHESFENNSTAALMNEHFVNIKVDREERPDLDSIYMTATQALTGSGGWPMSVFLTPDLQPFYAGTYFPPVRRYNMPSFKEVLLALANAWKNEREKVLESGQKITAHIQAQSSPSQYDLKLTKEHLSAITNTLHDGYDWGYGGWGDAPKFPQPMLIEFLLRQSTRGNEVAEKMSKHVLFAMARGGMYDVVGGGFARYSVDNFWRTPHFEKMLYDNAQLAQAYLHAYMITGENQFRQICEETLDFILRELTHPEGGFYSSLDADSEGEEGKFYVWTEDELKAVLGDNYDFFKTAYGITESGNWEGKTILQRALDDSTLASRFSIDTQTVNAKLAAGHAKLLIKRDERIRPGTDDKILVSWNALVLVTFAEAGRYLKRDDYSDAAIRNAQFLLDNLYPDGRLLRSWRNGQAKHNAYLEDYAGFILGLLALYQTDANPKWYAAARNLTAEMVMHFKDPEGGFFDTRDDHETLLLRPKDIQDNATPSGNALAATALLQITSYGENPEWRDRVEQMLSSNLEIILRHPMAFAQWLCAADFAIGPVQEVAVIGDRDDQKTKELLDTIWKTYHVRQVVAISDHPPGSESPPLLQDRPLKNGQPTAYVCHNFVCNQPTNNPDKLETQLSEIA